MLGVNRYQLDGAREKIEVHPYDPTTAERQIARTRRVRAERDEARMQALLDVLLWRKNRPALQLRGSASSMANFSARRPDTASRVTVPGITRPTVPSECLAPRLRMTTCRKKLRTTFNLWTPNSKEVDEGRSYAQALARCKRSNALILARSRPTRVRCGSRAVKRSSMPGKAFGADTDEVLTTSLARPKRKSRFRGIRERVQAVRRAAGP